MVAFGQRGRPAGIADVRVGGKQTRLTPAGRGPVAMYSLSFLGTLPLSVLSGSDWFVTPPSPGMRGSPLPPQTAVASVLPNGMQGRDQVNPPFVDRETKTPLASFVRSKW